MECGGSKECLAGTVRVKQDVPRVRGAMQHAPRLQGIDRRFQSTPLGYEGRCGRFFADEAGSGRSDGPALPERVEDAMADLAAVFSWTPADMAPMSLSELADWREQARRRVEAE